LYGLQLFEELSPAYEARSICAAKPPDPLALDVTEKAIASKSHSSIFGSDTGFDSDAGFVSGAGFDSDAGFGLATGFFTGLETPMLINM
jgi:hypothetical protein